MACEEILQVVFPLLEGKDLATCNLVCKQWREIARDDYLWKCLCEKKWPSLFQESSPLILSYFQLFESRVRQQPDPAHQPDEEERWTVLNDRLEALNNRSEALNNRLEAMEAAQAEMSNNVAKILAVQVQMLWMMQRWESFPPPPPPPPPS